MILAEISFDLSPILVSYDRAATVFDHFMIISEQETDNLVVGSQRQLQDKGIHEHIIKSQSVDMCPSLLVGGWTYVACLWGGGIKLHAAIISMFHVVVRVKFAL